MTSHHDTVAETLQILALARDHAIDVDERLAQAGQRPAGQMFVTMPMELLDVVILGLETATKEREAAASQRRRWRNGQRVAWVIAAVAFVVLAVR